MTTIKIKKSELLAKFREHYVGDWYIKNPQLLVLNTDPLKNALEVDDLGLKYIVDQHAKMRQWHTGNAKWVYKNYCAALMEYKHRFGAFHPESEARLDGLLQRFNAYHGGVEWQHTTRRLSTPSWTSKRGLLWDYANLEVNSRNLFHARQYFLLEPTYRTWTNRTPPKWYTKNWPKIEQTLELYAQDNNYEIEADDDQSVGVQGTEPVKSVQYAGSFGEVQTNP